MKRFTNGLAIIAAGALLVLTGCSSEPDDEETPEPGPTPSTAVTPVPSPAPGGRWQPLPGTAWQWQLSGGLDASVDVPVYDIDGFLTSKEEVAGLKKAGRRTICYISTGAWEDFRPDSGDFPKDMLGEGNGWKGERWIDVRRLADVERLMAKRFDMCRDKGFDAVEPDNMDAYHNDSGFPVTAEDQLKFNRMIAKLAHDRGLAVGLKNDLDQIPQLVGDYDFAVNEQCAQYRECDELTPFIRAGKAVFHVEYELSTDEFCARSKELKLSSLEKKLELGPWRKSC
ncbi:endo alpha-1,4 polygalactosaminidase [Streptomyces sp. AB3(2024)]|uniref:endo alpha-1,4 polygalactosaminidase n=1 Tax=Streptomyces sp. AB3(2024) TaxID=3317321 RepID=UPI0035A34EAC